MGKGKSADGLMRHIRDNHQVDINGSIEKQELLNMGYYHGYKASRFVKNKNQKLQFKTFHEIKSVYEFDLQTKSIFYPMLIKIETSLKNRLIDCLAPYENTDIEYIFNEKLTDYKAKSSEDKDYKKYLNKRLNLRTKIDNSIAYNYSKGHPCIQHFFHSSKPIPIWAYFEVITLGEFGNFVSCINKKDRIAYTEAIGLHHTGMNQNGRMVENIIFCITGLRNATMHNSMIFDCRFNNNNFSNQLKKYLSFMTNIENIDFNTITDFLILLIFLMKKQKSTKTELNKNIREYEASQEFLYKSVPSEVYFSIMGTDAKKKIEELKIFVKK